MSIPTQQQSPSFTETKTTDNILYFLQESEKKINFGNYKQIVLILGNTGAGKSTLTQFLVGDNNKLISQAPDGGSISANGEYIISDNNIRISDSTINSKTVLPELVVDSQTNTALYDCPGFSDTRSATVDIASTYFTKKLIDSSEAVKLVFVVNHSSVTEGNDRIDFITLVRHITNLVKDIGKFRNSIALVATKVNNNYVLEDDTPKLVSDTVVISYIAKFLIRVKNDMITNLRPAAQEQNLCKDKIFCENAIKLIDILLSQEGGNYTKIGIFRRPNKSGPLSKIKQLQDGKRNIEKILHENIKYTFKNSNDFGYTISDSSKNAIHALVLNINNQITLNIATIGQKIKKHYQNLIERSKNLYMLKENLNTEHDTLSTLIENTKVISNPSEFLKEIIGINKIYPTVYISGETETILKQKDYLDFLQLIRNQNMETVTKPLDWIEPLRQTEKFLTDINSWYDFLIELYDKLSSYEIQRHIIKSNDYNLNFDNGKEVIKVTSTNFETFLKKLDEVKIRETWKDKIKNIQKEIIEFETLNNIFSVTLQYATRTSCLPNGMVITGDFVKFSDINLNECGSIKYLDIYATNTIFIDQDFDLLGLRLQLSIIAPKWETINTRIINLDGISVLDIQPQAAEGTFPGGKGVDGKPGLPGGLAGNFFGIAKEFINGEGLTISANGGQGGMGQNGGKGAKGKEGISANSVNYRQFSNRRVDSDDVILVVFNSFEDTYRYYGTHGTPGGDGGHGGVGGIGGKAGKIQILNLDLFRNGINISNREGISGIGGQGGLGGKGGKHGDSIDVRKKKEKILFIPIGGESSSVVRYIPNYESAKSGKDGTDNFNLKNQKNPEPNIIFQTNAQIINNFKSFLLENLQHPIKAPKLTQFLDRLNKSTDSTILDFIVELQILETKFYHLKDKIDFLPLYQSLLTRIGNYAKNPAENQLQHKKVLNFLYTATLSKICLINDSFEGTLIIDIKQYLNEASNNIQALLKISNLVAVDSYNQDYKFVLDQKIDEAKNYITNQINPDISAVNDEIDQKVDDLINETITLQQEVEEHIRSLKNEEEKLRMEKELGKSLVSRLIGGVLKGISGFIENLGVWGKITGFLLRNKDNVDKSLALEDKSNRDSSNQSGIKEGVKFLLKAATNGIKNFINKKVEVLDQHIKTLSQDVSRFPDIIKTVTDTKDDLMNLNNGSAMTYEKIKTLENDLKEKLLKKEKELEEKGDKRPAEILKRLNLGVQIAEISTDIYLKYKNDDKKLIEIGKAIKQSEIQLRKLKEYEEKIFTIMIPILNGLQHNVGNLELDSKSRVSLDITKWQIQRSIKDVKFQMKQFTKGFEIQENLIRSIEKLDESTNTLINIYDRMENYNEHKKLADYIANVYSATSNGITVNDRELSSAINQLELMIKSNIILDQYETALNAFKQYIFPFADHYLKEFELRLEFNNTRILVDNAVQKIEILKSKLTKSDTSILKHDKFIFEGDFNSRQYNNTLPFFVWKNLKYRDLITKLLTGDEISLKADILNGLKENAVKFNSIKLNFHLNDDSLQKEFDIALQNFTIQITHLGNSYYRCNDKFYVITSVSLPIIYSYAKNTNGDPVYVNEVYKKINGGDLVVSPYAMWNIKLLAEDFDNFDLLKKYRNLIDLELVGHAQYVKKNYYCSPKLENFYKIDETIVANEIYQPDLNKIDKKFHSRGTRSTNDFSYYFITSSASTLNNASPLNNAIKWIKNHLFSFRIPNINGWLTEKEINTKQKFEKPTQGVRHENIINPIGFYDQVDSVLVLAPVLLHLWNKNFYKKTIESKKSTYIKVTVERPKVWRNFLEIAQKIIKLLTKNFGDSPILTSFCDLIKMRQEEIESRESQEEIEAFEKNLVALLVDLEDEVKYNVAFSKIKSNSVFNGLMYEVNVSAEKLPGFMKKLESVKLNYSPFSNADEERRFINNGLQGLEDGDYEFIVNDYSYVIGNGISNMYETSFGLMGFRQLEGIE